MPDSDRDMQPRAAAGIVLVAAGFALATGVIEAVITGIRSLVFHRMMFAGPDAVWMSPLAYLVFYLCLAVPVAVVARLARREVAPAVSVGAFAGLSAFALLLPYQAIATVATAVLAIGVGVSASRSVVRRPDRASRLLRRSAAVLAAFVLVAGVSVGGWRLVAERRALSGLPGAAPGAPNILVIVLDTVRRGNLGLYGYGRLTTEHLGVRAAESVVFDRAFAPSPWTLPSHASLFTGRPAGSLRVDWRVPLGTGPRTLAEVLAARGYLTAGFVGNLLYTSRESGLARGFAHYDDYRLSPALVLYHASFGRTVVFDALSQAGSLRDVARAVRRFSLKPRRVPADVVRPASSVTDAFLAWRAEAGSRPFFAFLNYFDAHGPYRSPAEFAARFRGGADRKLDRYDASIAWLDHEVGRLLDTLAAQGVLDRTIVALVSDHGEHFGEHGLQGHANSLYLPVLEVPLLIRYPAAVPAGRRIGASVTIEDVPATLLDLAGAGDALPGTSLARYWREPAMAATGLITASVTQGINVDTALPNGRGPMGAILAGELHYIRDGVGREELYAWPADSQQVRDLAADPARQADLVRMRRQLDSARTAWADALR